MYLNNCCAMTPSSFHVKVGHRQHDDRAVKRQLRHESSAATKGPIQPATHEAVERRRHGDDDIAARPVGDGRIFSAQYVIASCSAVRAIGTFGLWAAASMTS
jgi:hypothetical protein